jgi:hypothetical protein
MSPAQVDRGDALRGGGDDLHPQGFGNARAIGWVTLGTIVDMTLLDEVWRVTHRPGCIIEQGLSLLVGHQIE